LTGNFATLAGRLREVAAALDGREEIGDGFVARVCAEVQRRLWHPPLEQRGGHEQVELVLAPPALRERRHRGFTRLRIAVRRHAVLMMPEVIASTSTRPRLAKHWP
jgi:hypothetical protein